MRIAGTLSCSLVNGPGIRYVVFCQGCSHHCKGCQNPETWDFDGGTEVTPEELARDITARKYIDGVTLSGGDPFFQQEACVALLDLLPKNLNIWVYTGFRYSEIKDTKLAKMSDSIVDGKFEIDKKIDSRLYGSSNQQIINIEKGAH